LRNAVEAFRETLRNAVEAFRETLRNAVRRSGRDRSNRNLRRAASYNEALESHR
jgi:hypothetical protein